MALQRSRYPLQAAFQEPQPHDPEISIANPSRENDINGSAEDHLSLATSQGNGIALQHSVDEEDDSADHTPSAHIETTLPASPPSEHERFRKRSLRRTPGSGRLKDIASQQSTSSRESLDRVSRSSPLREEHIEDNTMSASNLDTRDRQGCPVDHGESSMAVSVGVDPVSEEHISDHYGYAVPSKTGTVSLAPEIHDGPPLPTTSEAQSNGIASSVTISQRRKGYPLQAPASAADLKQALTSPESPKRQEPVASPPPATSNSKTLRRSNYPLQAPASIVDLKATSADEHQSEMANQYNATSSSESQQLPPTSKSKQASSSMQQTGRISAQPKSLRRSIYPLQSPASIPNFQRPITPPSSGEDDTEEVALLPIKQEYVAPATQPKSSRRNGYPLQAQVSIPALREEEPQEYTQTAGDYRPSQESTLRRRGYPLQPDIVKEAQSSGTGHTHAQESFMSAAKQARETELATKVINQWQGVMRERTGPVHLPKHLQAVKDANGHREDGRTIVVCLDGTGDKFDNDNSNIVHLISALKKDDPRQVTYYQAGIGTYGEGGLSGGIYAAADMAVGAGLGLHVRDAYHFLMHSYKEGDKICIFGFSRGAYTARCLAGMIHKVGLLPPRNIQQIPFAYEFYSNDTHEGWLQSLEFKATFCINVNVHFLGCFDSVASVGFIPRTLPLSSTPSNKSLYFRHAMSLDERRAKFKICRYQTKTWDDISKMAKLNHSVRKNQNDHPNLTDDEYKRLMATETPFDTDCLEVWFAGDHADVGGGAVANVVRHKLAQVPLRWMIRQTFECNTGILFKTRVLAEFGLDVHTLWPKYERLNIPHGQPQPYLQKYQALPPKSVRGNKLVETDQLEKGEQLYHLKSHMDEDWTPELVEDYYDVMAPLHDQLILTPQWWILELWPVEWKVANAPGDIHVNVGPNLGRYRCIEDKRPKVHWTVLKRGQQMGYKIKARAAVGTEWDVVV